MRTTMSSTSIQFATWKDLLHFRPIQVQSITVVLSDIHSTGISPEPYSRILFKAVEAATVTDTSKWDVERPGKAKKSRGNGESVVV
jgi:hypothetical protein